ncbi:hypothetical protein [Streptomyces sp. NPDC048425]|uniref:hypothetical protein n=1 Tax=Streptomyces sp. NPDC048425 TaxID=3365548 RepID=UPI003715279D
MFASLLYKVTRQLLTVPAVLLRREASKEAELRVLRHENAVLHAAALAPQADRQEVGPQPPRLAYLAVTNTFTLLRLLPTSPRDKDIEILALRHQLLILQRQVGKPAFTDTDRALLAGLLHHLPMDKLAVMHRQLDRRRPASTPGTARSSPPCSVAEAASARFVITCAAAHSTRPRAE